MVPDQAPIAGLRFNSPSLPKIETPTDASGSTGTKDNSSILLSPPMIQPPLSKSDDTSITMGVVPIQFQIGVSQEQARLASSLKLMLLWIAGGSLPTCYCSLAANAIDNRMSGIHCFEQLPLSPRSKFCNAIPRREWQFGDYR